MIDRFAKSDLGREIVAKIDTLRITCCKNGKGGVFATFRVSGTFGQDPFSDDEPSGDGGTALAEQADGLRFLEQLLREFHKGESMP